MLASSGKLIGLSVVSTSVIVSVPLAVRVPSSATVPVAVAADHRRILGAVDRDRHQLGRVPSLAVKVWVSLSVSPTSRACTAAWRVVERVGPGAAGQLEVAVAVVAQGAGLVREADRVVGGIDIGDRQRAVGGQGAVLGDRAGASSPPITGASSAPLIVMVTSWVEPSVAVKVCVSVSVSPTSRACTAAWRVVERVGPGAAGQLEVAVAVVAQGAGLVREADRVVGGIDIGDRQRAVGGQGAVLGHRAGRRCRRSPAHPRRR